MLHSPDPSVTAPPWALLHMINGAWVAQAIFVAAKLGIADMLRDGPKSLRVLSEPSGAHALSLYRVLRALASLGIFREDNDGRFDLTPMSECLRSDAAGSLRSYAIMMGEQWVWRSWGEIMHSVRTGEPAFGHVFGVPPFQYYAEHAEAGRISAEALAGRSAVENAAIVHAYRFPETGTVVDVGGGLGTLLASILEANPATRGVLFDLPHRITMARPLFGKSGPSERCRLLAGDF